jgi:hypothetical protein
MVSTIIVKHYEDEKLSTTTSTELYGGYLIIQIRDRFLLRPLVLENCNESITARLDRGAHRRVFQE